MARRDMIAKKDEPEPEPGPMLGSSTLRVEKRKGQDGVELRVILVSESQRGTLEQASPWRARHLFYTDYALARRKHLDFLFEGVGRPVIG